ncbi:MAG: flagellar basal-body MS-ring/collar protein FliF [Thalassobaculales bacterium]
MNPILQVLRNLGPVRIAAIGIVGIAVIGFFLYLMTRLSAPTMALLFGELDQRDQAQIISQMAQQNVRFELRGNQIFVPESQVNQLRLSLAAQGLPSAGSSVGYELFDKGQSLGTTNFVLNLNHLRALEGELSRTIASIQGVRSARVHLVLPRRELFSRERTQPSASIVLRMQGGRRLEREQVQAVQHLVSTAVPDLKPERISIIDDRGTLLARGAESGNTTQNLIATAEEMRLSYQQRVSRDLETLIERTVGFGKVRAEVAAELDFDQISETTERFDPDQQVVRSTQTIDDRSSSRDRAEQNTVTVQNNLPEGQTAAGGNAAGAEQNAARVEETVNYEIGRSVRTVVRGSGTIRKLSVAVLIDGVYADGPNGAKQYQPRSDQELQAIERLVRSAIGFDQSRGDVVQVVNLQFAPLDDGLLGDGTILFGLSRADFLQLAEIIVLSVVGLLVVLLVVRPVLTRLFESLPQATALLGGGAAGLLRDQSAGAAAATAAALAGPDGLAAIPPPDDEEDSALDSMIDISRVEGRVRASSLRKIGEIVEKHPEEAVAIIRNWMYQEQS